MHMNNFLCPIVIVRFDINVISTSEVPEGARVQKVVLQVWIMVQLSDRQEVS